MFINTAPKNQMPLVVCALNLQATGNQCVVRNWVISQVAGGMVEAMQRTAPLKAAVTRLCVSKLNL